MMNSNHIKQLTKKFFDGDTTLEEEQTLYAYFASDDIEPSLMSLRDMFRDLAALHDMAITADISTSTPPPATTTKAKRRSMWTAISTAAAVILLLVIVKSASNWHEEQQLAALYEGSYMIIDGKRIDNLRELKPEIEKSLSEAEKIERLMTADDAAREAELDILNAMSSDEERKRIEMMINE